MTIALKTGINRPPRPEDYCTKIAAVGPARSGTPCPLWMAFLRRVTGEDDDLIGFLQRWLGYCLTGITTEHVLVFLYGTGANGKSVFVNTVSKIFNDYAVVAPMEMLLASTTERHPTEIAKLMGARLVTAHETAAGRRWDETKLKVLTGGDKLTARLMRQDYFDFVPQFKLMIVGNHKPSLRSLDEAIRRRFLLVPFTVQIPEHERDPDLTEKLKSEWPAILRWMVDGCGEWRRIGLDVPPVIRKATADYFLDQDTLGEWVNEALEIGVERAWIGTGDLFSVWRQWCELRNLRPGSEKSFSEALKDKGFEKKRQAGTGRQGFARIAFKPRV